MWSDITPERRAKLLADLDAAIDEPYPEGTFERANAVMAATTDERAALGWQLLANVALFIDDVQVAHPELDDVAIRRVASDAMARALMLLVRSARLREGRDINPARAAIASYFVAEEVLETAQKLGGVPGVLDSFPPGAFRAELEASGLIEPRGKREQTEAQS